MSSVDSLRNLSVDAVVCASPQQVSCDIANEAVLLSMCDGEYYGLNEVAASIWQLIQQPRTVREVRDALLAEYEDIQPAECERAVLGFLTEMIALNLVTVA
jgi:hypothetical protein